VVGCLWVAVLACIKLLPLVRLLVLFFLCVGGGWVGLVVVGWGWVVVRGWGCSLLENCTVDASIFVAKLLRAHGGCLGIRSR
jgi:hypothetical protein